jgi:Trk K+ transport system NAD-binding subunit
MKIGILGAGTLGKFLAGTFCNDKHDVTVIDKSTSTLARIRDKFDVNDCCRGWRKIRDSS